MSNCLSQLTGLGQLNRMRRMTSKYDNSSEMCFQKELALSVPFEMVDEESIYVWQNAGMSGK